MKYARRCIVAQVQRKVVGAKAIIQIHSLFAEYKATSSNWLVYRSRRQETETASLPLSDGKKNLPTSISEAH